MLTIAAAPASARIKYFLSGMLGGTTFSFETTDTSFTASSSGIDAAGRNVIVNGFAQKRITATFFNIANFGGLGVSSPFGVEAHGALLFTSMPGGYALLTGTYPIADADIGAGSVTITAAPGAPAPLLGLGLLPAITGAGGLALTRRRRKQALVPGSI